MARPSLINSHPNEYSQVLRCYPFVVNLGRCTGSCNTLKDLSNRVCVASKTKDLNINVFNMITRINESKILRKKTYISCKCECKFHRINVIHIKSGVTIHFDVSVKIRKNIVCAKKIMYGILLYVVAKMANI